MLEIAGKRIALKSDFEYLNECNNAFCAKFCILKSRHFVKENFYKEAKKLFLLAVFFDDRLIKKPIYTYMLNNTEYEIEEFDRKLINKKDFDKLPYSFPKNSIYIKGQQCFQHQ